MPHSYLVCASQRSGSTLLVKSLKATGLAGNPQEFFQYHPDTSLSPQPADWFAGVTDESILRLLGPSDAGTPSTETCDEWRARIRAEGTGPNGVWGGKLMWNQTPLLFDRAAGLSDRSGTDLLSAIHDTVGDVKFVKVTRDDVIDQAVSFWRAVQTRVWEGPTAPELDARARYHPEGIAHLVQVLRDQERGWRTFFAANGIEPVEVDFTELATDTERVLSRVLDELEIPAEAPEPALKKQGDHRSSEWAERYRDEAQKAGLPT